MAGVTPAPLCSLREPRHKGERGVSCGCRGGGRPSRETGPPGPTPGPAGAHRAPGRGCCGLRRAWCGQRAPARADVPATAPGSGLRPVCAKALGSEAPGPAREPRFPGAASGGFRGPLLAGCVAAPRRTRVRTRACPCRRGRAQRPSVHVPPGCAGLPPAAETRSRSVDLASRSCWARPPAQAACGLLPSGATQAPRPGP